MTTRPHDRTTARPHTSNHTYCHKLLDAIWAIKCHLGHTTKRPHDHTTTRPHDHTTTRPHDHTTTRPYDHTTTRVHDHQMKLTTGRHTHTSALPRPPLGLPNDGRSLQGTNLEPIFEFHERRREFARRVRRCPSDKPTHTKLKPETQSNNDEVTYSSPSTVTAQVWRAFSHCRHRPQTRGLAIVS